MATPRSRPLNKELGVAVIGAGRIGTLRARLAAKHPSVRFIAISDADPERARNLAQQTGAAYHCADNDEAIARPEVNAVFVSTPEGQHAPAVRKALELGKAVLVEKPIALSLADADDILGTLRQTGGTLRVGYSRRFKECFLRAKEQTRSTWRFSAATPPATGRWATSGVRSATRRGPGSITWSPAIRRRIRPPSRRA
ncbi:MAG: hypothetical protein GEV05_02910 [Betaproteobacteria bacterium]|nr:hypothetical protein [Betaproteobacteria bacterium]